MILKEREEKKRLRLLEDGVTVDVPADIEDVMCTDNDGQEQQSGDGDENNLSPEGSGMSGDGHENNLSPEGSGMSASVHTSVAISSLMYITRACSNIL